jgi:SnoaL-like domain
MSNRTIDAWHQFVRTKDSALLKGILADKVKFHSPVVHTPQSGKAITLLYLESAHDVLANDTFRYERELVDQDFAVLEFTVEIKGILINGVDMISWDEDGMITDFKVMIRPLQAINIIHQEMAARLQAAAGKPPN